MNKEKKNTLYKQHWCRKAKSCCYTSAPMFILNNLFNTTTIVLLQFICHSHSLCVHYLLVSEDRVAYQSFKPDVCRQKPTTIILYLYSVSSLLQSYLQCELFNMFTPNFGSTFYFAWCLFCKFWFKKLCLLCYSRCYVPKYTVTLIAAKFHAKE